MENFTKEEELQVGKLIKKETRVDKWKDKWQQNHGTQSEHDVMEMDVEEMEMTEMRLS